MILFPHSAGTTRSVEVIDALLKRRRFGFAGSMMTRCLGIGFIRRDRRIEAGDLMTGLAFLNSTTRAGTGTPIGLQFFSHFKPPDQNSAVLQRFPLFTSSRNVDSYRPIRKCFFREMQAVREFDR